MNRIPIRDLSRQPLASLGAGDALLEVSREVESRLAILEMFDPSQARPMAKRKPYSVAFFNFDFDLETVPCATS